MCWQVKRPRAVKLERCTRQVVGRVVKGEQYGLGKKRVGGRWAKRGCMRGELSVAQQRWPGKNGVAGELFRCARHGKPRNPEEDAKRDQLAIHSG
jgi:hypothetical protein